MANYPESVGRGEQYLGSFPEACKPVTVMMNGVAAPAIVTDLPGGGVSVEIEANDVGCPVSGDGSIVVTDSCDPQHVWTTKIKCT